MGFHTFDVDRAANLEDESRYRYLSREELVAMVDPHSDWTVADLGSGTGFFADDLAPFVEMLYAVDVQPEMHEFYRKKGVPENVSLVTSDVSALPFENGELDAAFSTMTYHEFHSEEALAAVHQALAPDGRFVIADWSAAGEHETGPPLDERYDLARARDHLSDAGFEIESGSERPETFVVVAVR